MLNTLKYYLGVQTLEEDRDFYRKQWTEVVAHFLAVNDHLTEIKEILKIHDEKMSQSVCDNHIIIMARLGLILTALEKIVPIPTGTSGYAQAFPLKGTSTRGRPKKMKEDKKHA